MLGAGRADDGGGEPGHPASATASTEHEKATAKERGARIGAHTLDHVRRSVRARERRQRGVGPAREYTGGDRGWIGDSPFIFLETKKVRNLGWRPKLTIRQGVEKTVE